MESFDSTPEFLDSAFTGPVSLFPLPNLVLFPHTLVPLHIFEPRYITMLEDALQGDRHIAMAQLKPRSSTQVLTARPEIYQVVCIGRVMHQEQLANGRYNLILQGVARARIIEELPLERPYRQAHVEVLNDPDWFLDFDADRKLREKIVTRFRQLFPKLSIDEDLQGLFSNELQLGVFCDLLTFALKFRGETAQRLLDETDPVMRAEMLIQELNRMDSVIPPNADRQFPPEFSDN